MAKRGSIARWCYRGSWGATHSRATIPGPREKRGLLCLRSSVAADGETEDLLKKVLALFVTALFLGVSCAGGGGPSDEFCDDALKWVGLLGENLGADETGAIDYAQLETSVAEITAALDDMAAGTDEEAVLNSIATVKTAFEDFAETRDIAALEAQEVEEATNRIEAYAADCEGFQEAADEASADRPGSGAPAEGAEGEEVDEGLEALEAVVKNAATAQESYFTTNLAYTESVEELESEGLEVPEGITVEITLSGQDGYCVQASDDSGSVFRYDSSVGQAEQGECS